MKIAIIGSREFNNKFLFFSELHKRNFNRGEYQHEVGLKFISGGAPGVDTWAEEYAKLHNIPIEIVRPINQKNKLDYLFRNVEIITKADKIIAFWDGKSRGTKFVIDYAKERNKNIEVIEDKYVNLQQPLI